VPVRSWGYKSGDRTRPLLLGKQAGGQLLLSLGCLHVPYQSANQPEVELFVFDDGAAELEVLGASG
jgi:hypothetical protein